MSNSSFMGGSEAPTMANGRDVDALGPSDTSDSGSDIQGETQMPTLGDNAGEWGSLTVDRDSDSDAMGTGERASATGSAGRDGADILPDRVFDPETEALGGDDDAMLASTDVAELPDDETTDPEADDAIGDDEAETGSVESPRDGGGRGSVESAR